MAQPQAYNREVDFTERDGDDTNHAGINAELDAAALSINQIRDNLALIQRDDGGLQNGIVTAESLAPSAFDAVLVEVNAAVQDAQTAAGSATLAATTAIEARDDAQAAQSAAETASNAASLNATTAATKAAEAAASATSAATSASTATTKASEASNSATNAATSATAAAGSATTASTQAANAANSATDAATSATNAATSATTATTQAGIATTQASNAAASATAAAASLDDFDDRYLGSKTTDPTTDNDGNPLITGALYFNSVAGEMRVWAGTFWKAAGSSVGGTINTAKYTATAGQTEFAIVYDVGFVHVYLNGLKLESGVEFTANNGTSVVLATGAIAGDVVDMIAFGIFSVANTYTKDELNAPDGSSLVGFQQAGTGAVARTVAAKLKDLVSVKDFGVVGNPAAISAALVASGGKPIALNGHIVGGQVYDPGHPAEEVRIVGGAIRGDAGAWSPIDDSGHDPFGITTVNELDAYTLRVNFNGDNTKVGALIAAVDKELAPYAIIGGCSCSANYADFRFYAPVIVDLQNSSTPSVAPWLASYVTLGAAGTYSTIINHPPRALNVDPPGVTLVNRVQGASRDVAITWGQTSTTITTLGQLGALVQRTGSGTFSVSQQTTQGTVSASWSGGGLTITHPDCGAQSTPIVTSHNSAYRAEVFSFSATSITVVFRNAAGAVVGPTDDAEMKCWFTRTNAKFNIPMPTGFSARVDLGYLAVPLAAIQNISLNNFWLFGAMIK